MRGYEFGAEKLPAHGFVTPHFVVLKRCIQPFGKRLHRREEEVGPFVEQHLVGQGTRVDGDRKDASRYACLYA